MFPTPVLYTNLNALKPSLCACMQKTEIEGNVISFKKINFLIHGANEAKTQTEAQVISVKGLKHEFMTVFMKSFSLHFLFKKIWILATQYTPNLERSDGSTHQVYFVFCLN